MKSLIPICLVLAGCGISPTEPMRVNAAFMTDGLAELPVQSNERKQRMLSELRASAIANENFWGSPQEGRINPYDFDGVAKNRKTAIEDYQDGGFWTKFTGDTMTSLGSVAGLLGLVGVGAWLTKKGKQVRELKKKLDIADEKARRIAEHVELTITEDPSDLTAAFAKIVKNIL